VQLTPFSTWFSPKDFWRFDISIMILLAELSNSGIV
jgi:hypothetical protein